MRNFLKALSSRRSQHNGGRPTATIVTTDDNGNRIQCAAAGPVAKAAWAAYLEAAGVLQDSMVASAGKAEGFPMADGWRLNVQVMQWQRVKPAEGLPAATTQDGTQ